jgi:F-type H+-transporting ATPase subunit alpha
MSVAHQVAVIYAVTQGLVDQVPVEKVRDWETKFHQFLKAQHAKLLEKIPGVKDFAEIEPELKAAIEEFNQGY